MAVAFLLFDSGGKLLQIQPVIDGTVGLGYPREAVFTLGLVLFACVWAYVVPRTSMLGAVPSRKGRRYKNTTEGITYFDGPFIETKELLGGYVIVSAESLEEACDLATQYIDAVGAEEVDVRELE